jgi:hypothetical protein
MKVPPCVRWETCALLTPQGSQVLLGPEVWESREKQEAG